MFFSNKWANLAVIVAVAALVTVVLAKKMKVLDASGKDTGSHLGLKAAA